MPQNLKSGVFFEPVPFTDAAEWIRGKTPVTRAAWDAMLPELRGRAFLVTGIEDLNLLQEIRDIVSELPEGKDYYALQERIAEKLQETPHFNEESAWRRADLILRHNGFAAYAAQNWQRLKRNASWRPYWQYRTMGDEAVRESHAALHGLTLRHDDPFWEDHFPPWEWGCRCIVVACSEAQFQEIRRNRTAGNFNPVFEEKNKGWTLPEEGLKVLHEQQVLHDGGPNPKGVLVESKEMFKPGELAIPPAELARRYAPEDWAAFVERAKKTDLGDGRTVWDWMNGVPAPTGARAPRPRTTPPPPPPREEAIPQPAPAKATITVGDDGTVTLRRPTPQQAGVTAGTREKPIAEALRETAKLDDGLAEALAKARAKIETLPALERAKAEARLESAFQPHAETPGTVAVSRNTLDKDRMARWIMAKKFIEGAVNGKHTETPITLRNKAGYRSQHQANGHKLEIAQGARVSSMVHEYGHHLEYTNPHFHERCAEFLRHRAESSPEGRRRAQQLRRLLPGRRWNRDEWAVPDQFEDPYCGKVYSAYSWTTQPLPVETETLHGTIRSYDVRSTEILSMGFQYMLQNPVGFFEKDPEYYNFILNLLGGML